MASSRYATDGLATVWKSWGDEVGLGEHHRRPQLGVGSRPWWWWSRCATPSSVTTWSPMVGTAGRPDRRPWPSPADTVSSSRRPRSPSRVGREVVGEPLVPDVADWLSAAIADSGSAITTSAAAAADLRPGADPRRRRHRRVTQRAGEVGQLVIADRHAVAVELEHDRHVAGIVLDPVDRPLDEVDDDRVDQPGDAQHQHAPVPVRAGGGGAGGRSPTAASDRPDGASSRWRPRPADSLSCAPDGLRREQVDPAQFLTAPRVTIVAGKGGVGKTTVTAALALAASARRAFGARSSRWRASPGCPSMFGARWAHLRRRCIARRSGRRAGASCGPAPSPRTSALVEYLQDHGLKRISNRLASSGRARHGRHRDPGHQGRAHPREGQAARACVGQRTDVIVAGRARGRPRHLVPPKRPAACSTR